MPSTYLEPTISVNSAEAYNAQSIPATSGQLPENRFEDVLNNVSGTTETLSFLASDGLAFSNAENPSFGGTVVSTAINNVAGTSPSFAAGGGYGTGLGTSGFSGGGFPGGNGFASNIAHSPGFSNSFNGAGGANTADGFNSGDVKQGILDEGLQQIVLMAEVQQASRTLDAYSNILKTKHDADMNTIRNIRS